MMIHLYSKLITMKYLFCILISFNLSAQVEFDKFSFAEDCIEVFYLSESGKLAYEDRIDSNHIFLKFYSDFDDSIILMANSEVLFEGISKYTGDCGSRLFVIDKRIHGDFILLKFYSTKFKTKIETPLDSRFDCVLVSFCMGTNIPPIDWYGAYPIKCSLSYRMGGCLGI